MYNVIYFKCMELQFHSHPFLPTFVIPKNQICIQSTLFCHTMSKCLKMSQNVSIPFVWVCVHTVHTFIFEILFWYARKKSLSSRQHAFHQSLLDTFVHHLRLKKQPIELILRCSSDQKQNVWQQNAPIWMHTQFSVCVCVFVDFFALWTTLKFDFSNEFAYSGSFAVFKSELA